VVPSLWRRTFVHRTCRRLTHAFRSGHRLVRGAALRLDGALDLGCGVGATQHPQLTRWLSEHNLPVDTLEESGSDIAHLCGTLSDGRSIAVRMANRDTRGTGLIRRLWAQVRLRQVVVGHVGLSSRSQLEQLALASLFATSYEILSPTVLLLNETATETLVLVMAEPSGTKLGEKSDLQSAKALFTALRKLHDAGIAHRDLRAENLIVSEEFAGLHH